MNYLVRLLDEAGENGESAERLATLVRDAIAKTPRLQSELACSAYLSRDTVRKLCISLQVEGRIFHNGAVKKGSKWIHVKYRENNAN
jgi:hypothetical protein